MPCAVSGRNTTRFRVFGYALERFEHQVEFTDIGEIAAAAVGAADVMFFDVVGHFLKAPTGRIDAGVFNEFVGAVTGLQSLQSVSGSEKPPTWPEATQTCGFIKIALSRPTL